MNKALLTGKLYGQATRKTARSGNPFTTAKVRVPNGDDSIYCNVIACDDTSRTAGPGDPK